ncbi:hypothetical protein NKY70_27700 [Sinorhizobium meliloti]|uniref:hypothetical protein n=1 Tax=Rhizobium meliloti TaxID=382 RepID=UPI003D650C16
MPTLKKVWSGELQRFSNGNTAINVRADAEDIDGAAIGAYLECQTWTGLTTFLRDISPASSKAVRHFPPS